MITIVLQTGLKTLCYLDTRTVAAPLALAKYQHLSSFEQCFVTEVCDLINFGYAFSSFKWIGLSYNASLYVVDLIAAADEM